MLLLRVNRNFSEVYTQELIIYMLKQSLKEVKHMRSWTIWKIALHLELIERTRSARQINVVQVYIRNQVF